MGTYCDECLTAAYDEGIDDFEAQVAALNAIEWCLPDHECAHIMEPDIPCDCLAHS